MRLSHLLLSSDLGGKLAANHKTPPAVGGPGQKASSEREPKAISAHKKGQLGPGEEVGHQAQAFLLELDFNQLQAQGAVGLRL